MNIEKEREAFEKECRLLCYKGNMIMSNLGSFYNNEQTNWMWQMWLSSKAQANKQFENFIDQAIEDSACADERRSLQRLLDEFREQTHND